MIASVLLLFSCSLVSDPRLGFAVIHEALAVDVSLFCQAIRMKAHAGCHWYSLFGRAACGVKSDSILAMLLAHLLDSPGCGLLCSAGFRSALAKY
ncbi:hypothetical protein Nepgr_008002 [Nepenthes gracilis]|uniref:Secreted protein n=1 Tax=Nepenthes gracilis TaxID=150966 RepID=A0AAD3XIT2_NEPGR|nr:hypothetical protein Nepgr_008002 [Nepenthes gracilis]